MNSGENDYIRMRDFPSSAFWFDGKSVIVEIDQILRVMPPMPKCNTVPKGRTDYDRLVAVKETYFPGYISLAALPSAIGNLWTKMDDQYSQFNGLVRDFGYLNSRYGLWSIKNMPHVMLFCNDSKVGLTFKHKKENDVAVEECSNGTADDNVTTEEYFSDHVIDLVDFTRHYPITKAGRAEIHDFFCKLNIAFDAIQATMRPFYEPLITYEQNKFRMWTITGMEEFERDVLIKIFTAVVDDHIADWKDCSRIKQIFDSV